MKSIQSYFLSLLALAGAAGGVKAESPATTNINPALTYFQAFIVAPDLSSEDRDYLFTNEWQAQLTTERFGNLLRQYDNEFKLIHAASRSSAPCEWGTDYSAGPDTLLAYLPRIKSAAVVARLRAAWDLQNGREADGRDDLLAVLKLARNGAHDGSMIGALVQIAVERIFCETVAENFDHFSPEVLQLLSEGLSASPRQSIAGCIPMEQNFCERWMIDRALELQAQYPGDDRKVLMGLHHYFEYFLADTANNEGSNDNSHTATVVHQVMDAAGGTSDGIIKLLRDMDPVYAKLAGIEALPFAQYASQMAQFEEDVKNSPNPLVREYLPAIVKCRPREFRALADIAMVQAAVQYKLHGEAGLQSVENPCGQQPFAIRRFEFEGADRGFELDSGYNADYPEVLIFVEKDGAPFQVFGKNAGKAP